MFYVSPPSLTTIHSSMEKIKKSSIGRQKIPIAKIPKKNHLQVTFSKRRAGLFKKASELCTLCGVEIVLVVFSPADKAFSFGHPEVESLINRYLARSPTAPAEPGSRGQLVEAHRNANVRELNVQLTQVLNQLEVERKKGEALDQVRKASRSRCWWEAPVDDLGLEELEQLRVAMEELRRNVAQQAKKVLVETSGSGKNFPFLGVNSSMGHVDSNLYETKPSIVGATNVASTSSLGHVHNFGYGHGLF